MAIEQNARTQLSFDGDTHEVTLSHLIELMKALEPHKDNLVVVGGWAPYFLLKKYQRAGTDFVHTGSIDIDIAVNPEAIDEIPRLEELLRDLGYTRMEGRPGSHSKTVETSGGAQAIIVDFLAPYDEPDNQHRHRRVQDDFMARKAHGAELALTHHFEFMLNGQQPDGTATTVTFNVADIAAMLAMKGYVLHARYVYKAKDAYDIYALALHYKEGVASVAAEVKQYLDHSLVQESLGNMREDFASENAVGPTSVADFFGDAGEQREQRIQQAFQQIQRLLELLGGSE